MPKGRIEAFSDGVLAVISTIMVLELKAPQGATFAALYPMYPVLLASLLRSLGWACSDKSFAGAAHSGGSSAPT